MKHFTKFLKKSRREKRLRQIDVEEVLRLRPSAMKDYETGRLKLPMEMAIKLADLYEVSLDQLVGRERTFAQNSETLHNVKALFFGNGLSLMFLDPVLRAALQTQNDKRAEGSLFDFLTEGIPDKKINQIVKKITLFMISLAAYDGVIYEEEKTIVRFILGSFNLGHQIPKPKKDTSLFDEKILGELFDKIEICHFTVWILFFLAIADGNIVSQEILFIQEISKKLKIEDENFILIKKKFIRD